MITFLCCLALLITAYFTYGRLLERKCGIGTSSDVPSNTKFDGVDFVPLPKWKSFLIQLLNIAGLGPIFGAVLGAMYGPVAFLWITFGGILFGAMHDLISGFISVDNGGASLPEIIGKYLGNGIRQFMRVFAVFLMILVGAVFILGPAGILSGMTGLASQTWVWIVLVYYIAATLLPIDKLIGKVYPLFGAALIFMAVGILIVLMTGKYEIPELTAIVNMHSDKAANPLIPSLFITIACGAISGFHATQSPMMARCINNRNECRAVFYGAMITESVIALIWAAIAMAFFGGVEQLNSSLAEHGNDAAWAVNVITGTTMGKIGSVLALLGVVAAPITSGDTAFRSCRLMVADILHVSQKTVISRLMICIPVFIIGYVITRMNYQVIWRYFAWANQTLSVLTLWAITVFLARKGSAFIFSLIPALCMTFICTAFLLGSSQMLGLGPVLSYIAAGCVTLILLILFLIKRPRPAMNRL